MRFPPLGDSRSRRSLVRALGRSIVGVLGASAVPQPAVARAARGPVEPATHPNPGCQHVVLILGVCPTLSTGISPCPFNGAPVTVRLRDGTVIFAGFVPANGQVVVGEVQSNRTYRVTVGNVLQPVPFPGGGADFAEMAFRTNNAGGARQFTIAVPCEREAPGGFEIPVFLDLPPQPGEIRGRLLSACGSTAAVPNRNLELFTTRGQQNPDGPPHPPRKVAEGQTTANGIVLFQDLDPCHVYRLRFLHEGLTREVPGLLAGTSDTTIGTPDQRQNYLLNAAVTSPNNAICDVLPDPP